MDQEYCLRWNNHKSNLSEVFTKHYVEGNLVDVTLAVNCGPLDDNVTRIEAHQIVLSACSPYFEKLLLQNKHPHPIIFLKDVTATEMEILLDFMYRGEVNVRQEDLGSILKTATALQIRGLTESRDSSRADENQPLPLTNVVGPMVRTPDQRQLRPNSPERKRRRSPSDEAVPNTVPVGVGSGGSDRYSEPSQCPLSFIKSSPPSFLNSQSSKNVQLSSAPNDLDTPPMSIKQEPPSQPQHDDDYEDSRHNTDEHSLDDDTASQPPLPPLDGDKDDPPRPDHPDTIDGRIVAYPEAEVLTAIFDSLPQGLARCRICGRVVMDVHRHYRLHNAQTHYCPYCPIVLTRADNLKRHIRIRHKDIVNSTATSTTNSPGVEMYS
ncbi:sex determination protein fruitless-like isoform X4 [Macrosteles quadrilineatus]|uniref:sex determination protein fruitless-like isoform X4 n=1 Tax=Macrosteles quadrilineatus TaxID=74068 RepID=UPI0023E0FE81|nr:sex determination protein fruitless-like isoform X4 [Macrosteles quadrilineatus]